MSVYRPAQTFRPLWLLIAAAVHLLAIVLWPRMPITASPPAVVVWTIPLAPSRPKPAAPPKPASTPPVPKIVEPPLSKTPAPAIAVPAPPAPSATAPAPAPATPASPAEATLPLGDTALRDVVKLEKQWRQAFPDAKTKDPQAAKQKRVDAAFDEAAALAPPKWYEASKVREIRDPAGMGRRIYQVIGAAGTYCIFYPTNHALDGKDPIAPAKQTTGMCPKPF